MAHSSLGNFLIRYIAEAEQTIEIHFIIERKSFEFVVVINDAFKSKCSGILMTEGYTHWWVWTEVLHRYLHFVSLPFLSHLSLSLYIYISLCLSFDLLSLTSPPRFLFLNNDFYGYISQWRVSCLWYLISNPWKLKRRTFFLITCSRDSTLLRFSHVMVIQLKQRSIQAYMRTPESAQQARYWVAGTRLICSVSRLRTSYHIDSNNCGKPVGYFERVWNNSTDFRQ